MKSRSMSKVKIPPIWIGSFLGVLTGCAQQMGTLGSLRPLEGIDFFSDQSSSRMPVEGTIPRGIPVEENPYLTGKLNGNLAPHIPVLITRKFLDRGRERYNIYCSPCHGYTGDGNGTIVQRGFLAPPSFHQERLVNVPAGHIFNVMTVGFGAMYSYADRVNVDDRWAIVAYIRAIQKTRKKISHDEAK